MVDQLKVCGYSLRAEAKRKQEENKKKEQVQKKQQ